MPALTERTMRAAHRHLKRHDPALKAAIKGMPPCPMHRRTRDLFHTLASAIVGQQLSVKAAATIERRVIAASGQNRLVAAAIAGTDDATLRAAGLSGAKTKYLNALAQASLDGILNFRSLARQPDDAVIETLVALPGIGEWTAQMFLMFALRRPDVFSPADVGLQRGVQMLDGLDEKPSHAQLLARAEVWRPYRSVACWYLWRIAG